MEAYLCSSDAAHIGEIAKGASELACPALILREGAAKTRMELEFAFCLARRAFAEKQNISGKPSNEALLFLACEENFSSAIRKIGAQSPKKFVLALEGGVPAPKLKEMLKLKTLRLLALRKCGKRKGHYTEGELAVERMAIARVRN